MKLLLALDDTRRRILLLCLFSFLAMC